MDAGFWSALPEQLIRLVMMAVGVVLLAHFALMALFLPRSAPWHIVAVAVACASCGTWIVAVSVAGELADIKTAAAAASIVLLLFSLLIWAAGIHVSGFFKGEK